MFCDKRGFGGGYGKQGKRAEHTKDHTKDLAPVKYSIVFFREAEPKPQVVTPENAAAIAVLQLNAAALLLV